MQVQTAVIKHDVLTYKVQLRKIKDAFFKLLYGFEYIVENNEESRICFLTYKMQNPDIYVTTNLSLTIRWIHTLYLNATANIYRQL